jgi:hypothetical protein
VTIAAMPYAIVEDVPASWEQYEPLGAVIADPIPEGLILHVAGPTDEGFRTIEVWETREAWQRFHDGAGPPEVSAPPILRELRAVHVVRGPR